MWLDLIAFKHHIGCVWQTWQEQEGSLTILVIFLQRIFSCGGSLSLFRYREVGMDLMPDLSERVCNLGYSMPIMSLPRPPHRRSGTLSIRYA